MNPRAARAQKRSNVTRITSEQFFHPKKGYTSLRDPSESILPILKANRGKTILLQVYRNGRPQRQGVITSGSHQGERYSMRQIYSVPDTDREINAAFRGQSHEGWFWHWRTHSDDPNAYHLQDGDEVRVFPVTELRPQRHRQRFADGIKHCVFQPMLKWAETQLAEATDKTNKKQKSRIKGLKNEIIKLQWRYQDGVPEHKLQSVVDQLGKYKCIHLTIELPFFNQPLNGPKIIDVTSKTNTTSKKAFHFINTRFDHVDELVDTHSHECDQDRLSAMLAELDLKDKFYLYQKAPKGITSISTLNGTFRLTSEYTEAVKKFEEETGLKALKIDAIKHPVLSQIVESSMHYNLPGLNTSDFTPAELAQMQDLTNLDRQKSYASFYKCFLYDQEKFPSKFTCVSRLEHLTTEEALSLGPGCYMIDQLDFSAAEPKFAEACALLRDPYRDLNTYPRPDLRYLLLKGVKFQVVQGAWAAGVQPYFDFRFPEAMLKKDEEGISHYAKWEGQCNSIRKHKTFHLKGSKKWFENLANGLHNGTKVRWYDAENGAGTIDVPKTSALHLTQITAYSNAYERIDVLEQLMKMQLDQVLWLDKDSICARTHDFDYDPATWRVKDAPSFKNDECPIYVSNLWQVDGFNPPERLPAKYVARALFRAHGCFGVGGGGKTTINLTDPCLLACGLCFVPPSYLLLEDKRSKLDVDGAVMAVALGKNETKWRVIEQTSSVIVWDEVSQWSMTACHAALHRFPHHLHIFCGDPGYQLPYIPDPKDPQPAFTIAQFAALGYPITRYDWSFRITGGAHDPLRVLCNSLRSMMDAGASTEALLKHVAKSLLPGHVLTAKDVIETKYKDIEETVLCSTNNHLREYNSALSERQWHGVKLSLNVTATGVAASTATTRKRKFRALEGSREPPNGTIFFLDSTSEAPAKCEERYASTVHDYQGRDTDKPIYIDTRFMFAREHPYTAVSRARSIEQLYLDVGTPEPPSSQYQRTKIYRIWSPNTDLVYVGYTTHEDLQRYFKGHFKDRKRTSRYVLDAGDARIELIEAWPCATQAEAEAREQHWIANTPNAVNVLKPKAHRLY